MAREDAARNAPDRVPRQCTVPHRPATHLPRVCGCTGRIAHTCQCRPDVLGCAMRREPFFWIISAWWVLFLLCLVGVFGGSAAG